MTKSEPGEETFISHLIELRDRLVRATIGVVIVCVGLMIWPGPSRIYDIIAAPMIAALPAGSKMIATGVTSPFLVPMKVTLVIALVLALPWVLYQLWAFIAPGLYAREKKWAYLFTCTAVPLFVGGAVLAYLVMDRGLHYLLGLAPQNSVVLPSWDTYLSYFTGTLLGFGVVFELPLVIVMLNVAGVLTHERFRRWRRVLIFCIFLVAGIVNPSPDPWTMLILGGLTVVLVEAAELVVWCNDRRRARLHPDPYTDLADDELSPLQLDGQGKD